MKQSNDPDVLRAMDVIMNWNVQVGQNQGNGIRYFRPTVNEVEYMAKEMLIALRVDFDRRA